MGSHRRCSSIAVLASVLVLLVLPATVAYAAPADSTTDSVSVYWTYWSASAAGDWSYVEQGAGANIPADGTSQGWRYGTGSTPTYSESPRTSPDFERTCSSTPAVAGMKRVAVVVDFGTAAEAPPGETPPARLADCASVPSAANGLQVISAVTATRQSPDGMMCGISGYPSSGCFQQIPLATVQSNATAAVNIATTTAEPPPGSWFPFAFGTVVVAILVASAVVVSRRRPV